MEFAEFVEKAEKLNVRYKVTQEVYNHFQKMSNDMNPLHTDLEFAKRKGFPDCVVYGNILNGFVSHFVGMALPSSDIMIQTQDIQYRKPIYINDEIILKSSIKQKSASVEIVIFMLEFYRTSADKIEKVATGHVQVGMLHDKIERH